MSNYNGWANYATWRVNLEIFDGFDLRDANLHRLDVYDLADALKEYTTDAISTGCNNGLALDYALAFLSDVNWREIAQSMIDTYQADDEDTDDEDTDDEELA